MSPFGIHAHSYCFFCQLSLLPLFTTLLIFTTPAHQATVPINNTTTTYSSTSPSPSTTVPERIHESTQLCSRPPTWAFYDIVSHLAAINIDESNSTSTMVAPGNSTVSPLATIVTTISGNGSTGASAANGTQAPIAFHYNANQTLADVTVRDPISNLNVQPFAHTHGNVTLIVLTNSDEYRLRNEQQIYNLEQIYRSLHGVHLSNVRFLLINSRASFNPRWVWETRKRVSFEVYQELPSAPLIGNLLDGVNGDIFIYDRCALLTYFIPFPLSFIHTQQPILQAAILATYFDSPCKGLCGKQNKTEETMVITQNTTVLETAVESSSSTPPVTESPTENVSETLISVTNQTAMPANETERSANSSAAGLNDMGQILMKFFGQILPTDSTVSNQTDAPPVQVEEEIVLVKNGTSLESHPSPQPVEASSNRTISVNGTVPLSGPSNATNAEPVKQASGAGQGVLTRLRGNNPNRPTGGDTCSQHSCLEWSTEKLLKARLCCLNSPEEETIRPSSTNSSVASLTAEKSTEEGDSAESVNDGSFGCQLYAKRKCSSIMPIIKCCLRKVLSKYFDFTIKLREQQQKAALAGRRHGSMVMTSSGLVADPKAQRFQDPRILEYPGDYALGGRGGSQYQPGEYFKQQHRKRVDGRTKMLSQQRR